jgi:hypothetical protein
MLERKLQSRKINTTNLQKNYKRVAFKICAKALRPKHTQDTAHRPSRENQNLNIENS